ncbi:MAG: P-II family nitrogen regulator [Solidesulfovibrio sp. DCME]|uniref:P-II family nitrogen regulator n=1 Tax=Solidesulfovibrio sp. DCME TaxID=3447380 RepID=UPI003D0B59CB
MKRIEAVIRPSKLAEVADTLADCGISGLTVEEARGFGRQRGHVEVFRGAEYAVDFVPKVKVTLVVEDGQVREVVAAIRAAAHTGEVGDGKIFVLYLGEAVRIRTGETGGRAL